MYLGDDEVAKFALNTMAWTKPGGYCFIRESCFRVGMSPVPLTRGSRLGQAIASLTRHITALRNGIPARSQTPVLLTAADGSS